MKKITLVFIITVTFFTTYSQEAVKKTDTTVTTYYLLRHTEKDSSNPEDRNPNLSETGIKRVENWTAILKNIDFDAVYSTDYNRTKQTAKPIAESNGLETLIYDLNTFDIEKFKSETIGEIILIVGHSNTTPLFANAFIGEKKYKQIDENDFSNLYIITIIGDTVSDTLLNID